MLPSYRNIDQERSRRKPQVPPTPSPRSFLFYWGNQLKNQWLDLCLDLSSKPANFYSGARKIIRPVTRTFKRPMGNDHLLIQDAGYTKSKLTMLRKNYLHEESIAVAVQLWNKRVGQDKYGSVSFTCFNHFVKGGDIDAKRSKRASVFGPCIQSVSLTFLNDRTTSVDVFYRTTELFKKFPADLVFLRDVLLEYFDFSKAPIKSVTFHFANVTVHPMYAVTIMPLLDDPIGELEEIAKRDTYFHTWVVKWTARYLCPEHHRGIQKFAQAMRVHKDANERLPAGVKKELVKYLRANHPGFKKDYVPPENDEDDD